MILPLLLLSLLPSAAGAPSAANAPQVAVPGANDPVVRVDEAEFTRGDLAQWLLRNRGESLARSFADGWLFAREARRLGLPDLSEEAAAQTEEEIQKRIKFAHNGDETAWVAELKTARRTPEGRRIERRAELERDLQLWHIANHERVVPEEKILREWEREYGPGGRRFRVRLLFQRVVMPPMNGMSRAEQIAERERILDERRAAANAIREKARAGEPFPRLVRELSEDPKTRGSGGRPEGGFMKTLGWAPGDLERIASLEPGEISDPILVQGGFWLVQLEELVETPLKTVEGEIRAKLEAAGPEPDELNAARAALTDGIEVVTLDALHAKAAPGEQLPLDTPVMTIGGESISRGEYADYLLDVQGDVSVMRFAEEMHIAKLAREKGIAPTDEEVEAQVKDTAGHLIEFFHKGDRAKWEEETARTRGSLEAWYRDARHLARLELTLAALFKAERVISDELVRQTWQTRYGLDGRSLHLRMIFINTVLPQYREGMTQEEAERLAAAAIEEAKSLAADVAERAKSGEDFAELARQFSMDTEFSGDGGELPFGYDHHQFPPEVVEVLDKMKPGEVAGPIEAGLEHFVFELLAVREVPYDTVASEIREELEESPPNNLETRGFYNVATRSLNIEVLPALNRR